MENKTKFDDWADVNECNECGHYWDDSCDGTPIGLERPCRVFKATRKMDIPEQVRKVREEVKDLKKRTYLLCGLILVIQLLDYLNSIL